MATSPLPPAAAQVLRRHVRRKLLIAALWSAVGVVLLGLQGTELRETAVLLQRGVSTQATVTENARPDDDLWTLLTVEFPNGSDAPEVAVILHEGVVEARHVQIVYDPRDPVTAQLEDDLQPGMLAAEFLFGGVVFILDGGELGRFQFAGVGFLLVVVAPREGGAGAGLSTSAPSHRQSATGHKEAGYVVAENRQRRAHRCAAGEPC
jgi:Protein of unknown function (DUF3592)